MPKQPKKKERRVDTKLHWHPAKVVLVVLGGCLLLIAGVYWLGSSRPPERPVPLVEVKSNDPALEAKVLEIASKFICPCGTCGELPLEKCTCSTAIQERQFIRSSLQLGQSPDQVVTSINTSYGWMKPEFAARYDSLARISGTSTRVTVPKQMRNPLLDANEGKGK